MPDTSATPPSYASRPERMGRKGVLVYLPKELVHQLKILAVTREVTMQSLVETAIMESLAKTGVKIDKRWGGREPEGAVTSSRRKNP